MKVGDDYLKSWMGGWCCEGELGVEEEIGPGIWRGVMGPMLKIDER